MNKVYLIITNWEYDLEEKFTIKVAKTLEKAREIFEEEKQYEGLTREMIDCDGEENVDIMQDETRYFATNDLGNYISIYIEEKEIEE